MRTSLLDIGDKLGIRYYTAVCSVCSKKGGNSSKTTVDRDKIVKAEEIGNKICYTFKEKIEFPCGHQLDKAYGKRVDLGVDLDNMKGSDRSENPWVSGRTHNGPVGVDISDLKESNKRI